MLLTLGPPPSVVWRQKRTKGATMDKRTVLHQPPSKAQFRGGGDRGSGRVWGRRPRQLGGGSGDTQRTSNCARRLPGGPGAQASPVVSGPGRGSRPFPPPPHTRRHRGGGEAGWVAGPNGPPYRTSGRDRRPGRRRATTGTTALEGSLGGEEDHDDG